MIGLMPLNLRTEPSALTIRNSPLHISLDNIRLKEKFLGTF